MFTFYTQLLDLYHLHIVGSFLVFFLASWSLYIFKLIKARGYVSTGPYLAGGSTDVSIIVPVVDEPMYLWKQVLKALIDSKDINAEIIVVPNGKNAVKETAYAQSLGLKVVRCDKAGKREAIECGMQYVTHPITVILDSDTIVRSYSIARLVDVFKDRSVGGATPRHTVFNRSANIWRRISDWMEDIRFQEVVKGQNGAISCLPGRLLAMRTHLLKEALPYLVNQTFLGRKVISGDDRVLTSWLLKNGYKTVYVEGSLVETNAPDTLKSFAMQRLRWSRSSLRETILSLPWIFKYPYTALTVISMVIFRWWFFTILVLAVLSWVGVIDRVHYINMPLWVALSLSALGLIASSFLRQLRHLLSHPRDLAYLPAFLFITTFILMPIEWYGNLSLLQSHWMTRKID